MSHSSRIFDGRFDEQRLDREPYVFGHRLVGHEALGLDNLSRVVIELPEEQVFYSSGLVGRDTNFDRAHVDHATGLSLRDTIENIRTSNSYVMVRAPEAHPSFRELFQELLNEVEKAMQVRGVGTKAIDPMLYLFIASPNSVTPFHIDRYSTLLLQFQGNKDLYVYPPWDARLVTAEEAESFVVWSGGRPQYRPEYDHLAQKFSFRPGETLHIPFLAPHHVHNGPDEVSVSLSIIFNTEETARQLRALRFNHKLRRLYRPFGLAPTSIGKSPALDGAKARVQGLVSRVRGA